MDNITTKQVTFTQSGALHGRRTTITVYITPDGEWCLSLSDARARYTARLAGRGDEIPSAPAGICSFSEVTRAIPIAADWRDGGVASTVIGAALGAGPNTVEWLAAHGAVCLALYPR